MRTKRLSEKYPKPNIQILIITITIYDISLCYVTFKKPDFVWTGGVSKKRFEAKDLDINNHYQYPHGM